MFCVLAEKALRFLALIALVGKCHNNYVNTNNNSYNNLTNINNDYNYDYNQSQTGDSMNIKPTPDLRFVLLQNNY